MRTDDSHEHNLRPELRPIDSRLDSFLQVARGRLSRLRLVIALRILVFVSGAFLVSWTAVTAITTVVLPRGSRSVINSIVFGSSRAIFGPTAMT